MQFETRIALKDAQPITASLANALTRWLPSSTSSNIDHQLAAGTITLRSINIAQHDASLTASWDYTDEDLAERVLSILRQQV